MLAVFDNRLRLCFPGLDRPVGSLIGDGLDDRLDHARSARGLGTFDGFVVQLLVEENLDGAADTSIRVLANERKQVVPNVLPVLAGDLLASSRGQCPSLLPGTG